MDLSQYQFRSNSGLILPIGGTNLLRSQSKWHQKTHLLAQVEGISTYDANWYGSMFEYVKLYYSLFDQQN